MIRQLGTAATPVKLHLGLQDMHGEVVRVLVCGVQDAHGTQRLGFMLEKDEVAAAAAAQSRGGVPHWHPKPPRPTANKRN